MEVIYGIIPDLWHVKTDLLYSEDVAGSFQQYVTGSANYLNTIPQNLSDENAAPLLCAGVTVYDALRVGDQLSTIWNGADNCCRRAMLGTMTGW